MSMEDVRTFLDPDEPDYAAAALALGPDAQPDLAELAAGDDPMMASKAVYLAGLIGGDEAPAILTRAAEHPDATVRVSTAATVRNLEGDAALQLGQRLLRDDDVGVRKVAVRSAGQIDSSNVRARLQEVAQADPDERIRSLAGELDA